MAEVITTVGLASKHVSISRELPTVIIGERINPTGRKKLQKELKTGKFDTVKADAVAQIEAGAAILDVNAGVPGADEPALLVICTELLRTCWNGFGRRCAIAMPYPISGNGLYRSDHRSRAGKEGPAGRQVLPGDLPNAGNLYPTTLSSAASVPALPHASGSSMVDTKSAICR